METANRWNYEIHWQKVWEEAGISLAQRRPSRPKWFIVELPPFANGTIHLGHVRNYTMGDVIARFRRMAGFDVLYTTGFDSFGLPNETAARHAKIRPKEMVTRNMAIMLRQFRRLGYSHDPRRILSDHEPRYYSWVQWVFLALMRGGFVYRHRGLVNWCGRCGSTLADSLVEAGRCWRCSTSVDIVEMDRWFIRETALAELVSNEPDPTGWPAMILRIHADWIGKKEGFELDLAITNGIMSIGRLTIFLHKAALLAEVTAIGVTDSQAALCGIQTGAGHYPRATGLRAVSVDGVVDLPLIIVANEAADNPGTPVLVRGLPGVSGAGPNAAHVASLDLRPALRHRLRDWDIARPRAWGTPVPIVHCKACGPVGVREEDLPVRLPEDFDFEAGNPLDVMPSFYETSCPACGAAARRDTETLEAYSSPWWYYLVCSAPETEEIFDGPGAADWMPVDVMIGGVDQARTCFFHLRTMTAALNRLGIVSETQPVRSLLATGMVRQDGRKMSKSAGNSIDPEQLIERHGADAVRIAVLWAAAPHQDFNWRDDLVRKAANLLRRIRLFVERRSGFLATTMETPVDQTRHMRQIRNWIETAERNVTDCLERNAFHIAIDQIGTLVDRLAKQDDGEDGSGAALEVVLAAGARSILCLIAPFAPHLAEELWARSGGATLVASQQWPAAIRGGRSCAA